MILFHKIGWLTTFFMAPNRTGDGQKKRRGITRAYGMGGREQAYCAAAAPKFLFQSEVGLMYPLHAAPDEGGCGIRYTDGDKRETKQHREHQGQIEQPGNNELDHGKPLFSAILFSCLKSN
jgi:hypothetical protein